MDDLDPKRRNKPHCFTKQNHRAENNNSTPLVKQLTFFWSKSPFEAMHSPHILFEYLISCHCHVEKTVHCVPSLPSRSTGPVSPSWIGTVPRINAFQPQGPISAQRASNNLFSGRLKLRCVKHENTWSGPRLRLSFIYLLFLHRYPRKKQHMHIAQHHASS